MQTKLKAILFERNMTQKGLGKAVGISERGITDKIRGKVDFTYTEVYNICQCLGIKNPFEVFEPKTKFSQGVIKCLQIK